MKSTSPQDSSSQVKVLIYVVVFLSALLLVAILAIGVIGIWVFRLSDQKIADSPKTAHVLERPADRIISGSDEVSPRAGRTVDQPALDSELRGSDPIQPLPKQWQTMNKAKSSNGLARWRYDLQTRQPVVFDYAARMSIQKYQLRNIGRVTYKLLDDDPLEFIKGLTTEESQSLEVGASGTGFVVHPEGVIVTCAHVVGDLSDVTVLIGKKRMTGRVVVVDHENDLALVKVSQNGLPYLPISTSSPGLGAPAKVFGFPLRDQLGESLKMTSGSVTGQDKVDNKSTRLQLDASANPGNSGGPVTDNQGRVIGVVDSILAASRLSDVSLAVPASSLTGLLKKHSIPYAQEDEPVTSSSDTLRICELEKVSRAVVLIETSHADVSANWRVFSFEVLNTSQTGPPFRMIRNTPQGKKTKLEGNLILDSRGQVVYVSEENYLPGTLQNLATIGLETLPSDSGSQWNREESMLLVSEITERSQSRSRSPFGPAYGGLSRPRYAPDPFGRGTVKERTREVIQFAAVRDSFKVVEEKPNLEIKLRREIETRQMGEKSQPKILVLQGTAEFDREFNWYQSAKLKGKARTVVDRRDVDVGFEFSFDRISAADLEKERELKDAMIAKQKRLAVERKEALAASVRKLDALGAGAGAGAGLGKYEPEQSAALDGGDKNESAASEKRKQPEVNFLGKIPKKTGRNFAAISPDGQVVATLNDELLLYRWNESTKAFSRVFDYEPGIDSETAQFTAGGKRIFVYGTFSKTTVLDIEDDKAQKIQEFDFGREKVANELGTRLACYESHKKSLKVFEVDSGRTILELTKPFYANERVEEIYLNRSGTQLVAVQGTRVVLVDVEKGEVIQTAQFGEKNTRNELSSCGRYITNSRSKSVFELRSGKQICRLPNSAKDIFVTPDGKWVIYFEQKRMQFRSLQGSASFNVAIPTDHFHSVAVEFASSNGRVILAEVFSKAFYALEYHLGEQTSTTESIKPK